MRTVTFIANDPVFIKDIADELTTKYNVRTFFNKDIRNNETYLEMMEYIRDSDVSFFDWCDPYIIEMTRGLNTGKKICRLHSYELFEGYPDHVNMDNLNRLIVVNDSMQHLLRYRREIPQKKLRTIYHGIDLKKFPFKENKERTHNAGTAGYINYKKDPSVMVNCFYETYKLMPNMKFKWAGRHQDMRFHLDFIHNMSVHKFNLEFLPWQDDMNLFFDQVDYVLSSSIFETCHLSILEGMAAGCIPLVRYWRGAENIYPIHSLFTMPDMCARKIALYEQDQVFNKPFDEIRMLNRKWVEKYFQFEREVQQISDLIQEVIDE